MNRRALFAALAVAVCGLLMPGCASLTIRVEILNSAYWSSPQYVESVTLAKITDAEQSIRDGRFVAQREVLKQDVRQALVVLSREKPPKPRIPAQDIDEAAKTLGLPVTTDMPQEVYDFMHLFAQPTRTRPSVEYVPLPHRGSPPGGGP